MNEPVEVFLGAMIVGAFVMGVILFVTFGLTGRFREHHRILERTDTGVICHVDRYYPSANCRALFRDLGPRLSTVKTK